MLDPDGVCAVAVVDNGKAEVVVVGDGDVFTVVVDVEVFLVRTGMVVFHWWV